jgi:hypothetical protein
MTTGPHVDRSEPVGFDTVAAHWRSAFDVAAHALLVVNGCRSSLGFAADELDERRGRLASERDTTAQLLTMIARDEHVKVGLCAVRHGREATALPRCQEAASTRSIRAA